MQFIKKDENGRTKIIFFEPLVGCAFSTPFVVLIIAGFFIPFMDFKGENEYEVISVDQEGGIVVDWDGDEMLLVPVGVDFVNINRLNKLSDIIYPGVTIRVEVDSFKLSEAVKENYFHVFVPGHLLGIEKEYVNLNSWLLRNGYAKLNFGLYIKNEGCNPEQLKYYHEYIGSEEHAKKQNLGVWKSK